MRQGEVPSRIGKMAELFDDHSPLQLGQRRYGGRAAFTLIGRLQYKIRAKAPGPNGTPFDDGTNLAGRRQRRLRLYRTQLSPNAMPPAERYVVGRHRGQRQAVQRGQQQHGGRAHQRAGRIARLPPLGQPFTVVELRSASGAGAGIDYTGNPPAPYRGARRCCWTTSGADRALKDESAKDEKGRQFNCPNCGAPVEVALATSKSVTCGSCNSIIDLSGGIGGELRSAIPGRTGTTPHPAGYAGATARRALAGGGIPAPHGPGPPGDDEQFGWSEYLLYNQKQGFSLLVDSEEGWSLVRPLTGAPTVKGTIATYKGKRPILKYSYQAETYLRAAASSTGRCTRQRPPTRTTRLDAVCCRWK